MSEMILTAGETFDEQRSQWSLQIATLCWSEPEIRQIDNKWRTRDNFGKK